MCGGCSEVHKSFQNFDVLRRHSSHQSKCGQMENLLRHPFHSSVFLMTTVFSVFWRKYSSDSASSRPLISAGSRVLRDSIRRALSSYLFLNCLTFLYFELPNYLMFSVFGKFTCVCLVFDYYGNYDSSHEAVSFLRPFCL